MDTVTVISPNGEEKTLSPSFSFTVFFFGFIPALFRRDWMGALALFVLLSVVGGIGQQLNLGILGFLVNLAASFYYNKNWLQRASQAGWRGANDYSQQVLDRLNR